MLPKFSIEASRLTITFRLAICRAPCARLTPMIAGRSCGVRPTAGHGEEEGVQGRAPQGDVDGEDDEDQDERDLHQKVAEPADAALEFGLGRRRSSRARDAAELGLAARPYGDGPCGAADHVRAQEEGIGPMSEVVPVSRTAGRFSTG